MESTVSTRAIGPLAHQTTFWRFDLRAIVSGVFFGIVMVLLVGLGDRADTTLTGGTFLIFGGITWAATMGVSTLLGRQPAGVIAGLIQGFVAIGLGASPLAITFPVVNAAGSLAYALVAWKLPMKTWLHHLLAQIAGNLIGNVLVSVGLFYLLELPVEVILVSSAITFTVGTIGGTMLTKYISEAISKSGVLD